MAKWVKAYAADEKLFFEVSSVTRLRCIVLFLLGLVLQSKGRGRQSVPALGRLVFLGG